MAEHMQWSLAKIWGGITSGVTSAMGTRMALLWRGNYGSLLISEAKGKVSALPLCINLQ